MNGFNLLVSLNTENNDYQRQQALAAEEAGRSLGIGVRIVHSDNDPIHQSQVLLNAIQSPANSRPDAIVVMPVGTGLAQVATAAANAGIGWAVVNRDVDYLGQLRRTYTIPAFSVSVDQEEIGRIQGKQISALAPDGGTALYIMGPAGNLAAAYRAAGMQVTKPANLSVRTLRGNWTEQSGYDSVKAWLRLSTSHESPIVLLAAQSDNMAMGARRAFEENTSGADRDRFCSMPFLGIDAAVLSQEWIHNGKLTASVALPITTSVAIELMLKALQTGTQPPEKNTPVAPVSVPELKKLSRVRAQAVALRA